MQIPDFPMKHNEGSSFVHHSVIREYLWDYAKHFNLYPHIKVMETIAFITITVITNMDQY